MFKLKLIGQLKEYIKAYPGLVSKALILALLLSLLEVLSTALVLPLTQVLANGTLNINSHSNGILAKLVAVANQVPQDKQLLFIVLAIFCVTIIKNCCAYFSGITISDFMLKCGTSLRQKCVERLLELDITFYTQTGLGEMLSYVNELAPRCYPIFSVSLEIIEEILLIGFLLTLMIIISPLLTAITILLLVGIVLSLHSLNSSVCFHGDQFSSKIESFGSLISEIVTGIRVVKSFNTEVRELEKAERALKGCQDSEFQIFKLRSAVAPMTETLGISVLLVILLVGNSLHSLWGVSTFPVLLTFTLTLLRILPRINHLNSLRIAMSSLRGVFDSVEAFLTRTKDRGMPEGHQYFKGFKKELAFEDLTFVYPSNPEPTLKNVNFQAKKGETTAIVGLSGSGKSTTTDMIMRFYDPTAGGIKIDGCDLRDLQLSSWRRRVAIVSQDTFLFNASVRDNIAYGFSDATDLEIIDAAKRAYAYEFIQDLPEGFDTIVGNRGTRLSGGQRQRIAIARAILCNPDILILDEATSALDSHSEKIVQQAIEEVSRDRTVLVIAHRLSTIKNADKIIVLQNGEVVEQGTHQQLLSIMGVYHMLYQSQSQPKSAIA